VKSPYGAIVKVFTDNKDIEVYIQINKDESKPNWARLGEFLEKIFDPNLSDPEFIKNCLNLYETKNQKHFASITKFLKP